MSRWLTAIKSSWEHLEQDWWMMFREHDSMTEIDSQQLKTMTIWKLECIQSIRCNSPLTIFQREESRLWMPILKFLYMAPPSCSWSWISDLFQKADWICGTRLYKAFHRCIHKLFVKSHHQSITCSVPWRPPCRLHGNRRTWARRNPTPCRWKSCNSVSSGPVEVSIASGSM